MSRIVSRNIWTVSGTVLSVRDVNNGICLTVKGTAERKGLCRYSLREIRCFVSKALLQKEREGFFVHRHISLEGFLYFGSGEYRLVADNIRKS